MITSDIINNFTDFIFADICKQNSVSTFSGWSTLKIKYLKKLDLAVFSDTHFILYDFERSFMYE